MGTVEATQVRMAHFHVHGTQFLRPLDYVELVLICLSFAIHAVYAFVTVRRHVVHVNLKIIYLSISFTISVFLFSRLLDIAMIIFDVHEDNVLHNCVHILHESSYTSIASTFLLISIERLFATLKSDSYEQTKSPAKVIVAFVVLYAISILIAYLVHIADTGFTILVIYVTICDTVTIVVTVGLLVFNIRAFKLTTRSDIRLSQRYQIRENIKVIMIAIPVNVLQIIAVTVALVAVWNMLLSENPDEGDRPSQRIYNISIILFALLMPIVARVMNAVGRRVIFKNPGASIVSIGVARKVESKQQGRAESHLYFKMLHNAWK
ncbi:hypothetical protein QR680_018431 [Steinernema hermaphroditum]|uniref:Uncharacterized protein n=1 Tax=Steinernema hermaphroditum TaxID=289476 RepID=A0AA39HIR8_9BILA|nr:hypothetical protein QR680_018431 [Steinernema hermaphroditum]